MKMNINSEVIILKHNVSFQSPAPQTPSVKQRQRFPPKKRGSKHCHLTICVESGTQDSPLKRELSNKAMSKYLEPNQ